jgi:spore germination protein GerM
MPRHIKFGLIALLIITLAGGSCFYDLRKRVQELVQRPTEPTQPYLTSGPVISESAAPRKVRLFFPSREKEGLLLFEEREIRVSELSSVEAKQIVAELIRGPGSAGGRALPPETKLRELFILKEGLAVVDFTKEVSTNHPGGITQEMASVYSIVNSLTQNVAGVKSVQILIEGNEAETLAGHVDISRPIAEDLSMTSMASEHSSPLKNAREQLENPTAHGKHGL